MSNETVPIAEAISILNAEKMEFDGSFKADCCGSMITKGNAFYSIMSGGEYNEVVSECCTRCLKKQAYYEKHRYDDFDAEVYLKIIKQNEEVENAQISI